jgi:hypothetical protein
MKRTNELTQVIAWMNLNSTASSEITLIMQSLLSDRTRIGKPRETESRLVAAVG